MVPHEGHRHRIRNGKLSINHVGWAVDFMCLNPGKRMDKDLLNRFRLQIGGNNWGDARLLQIGRDDEGLHAVAVTDGRHVAIGYAEGDAGHDRVRVA